MLLRDLVRVWSQVLHTLSGRQGWPAFQCTHFTDELDCGLDTSMTGRSHGQVERGVPLPSMESGSTKARFATSAIPLSPPTPQMAGLCAPAAPAAPGLSLHPPGPGKAEQVAGDHVSLGTFRGLVSAQGDSVPSHSTPARGTMGLPRLTLVCSFVPRVPRLVRAHRRTPDLELPAWERWADLQIGHPTVGGAGNPGRDQE